MNADDLATALTTGASGWLVLSVAAVLPILWAFTLRCTSAGRTSCGSCRG